MDPSNIYSYDRLDRVTDSCYHNSQDEEFVYDLLGNRTSVELRDNTTVSYTHNSVNGYIDIGGCDPDVAHDDNGNLTRDHRGYEYQYDVDNRLIYVYNDSDAPYGEYDDSSSDTLYAEYQYDAMGRRIYSKIASAEKKYIYDGQRVIVETDGDGDFERRYVFGNYIDEVLIIDDGTNDYYYGHDHLYSVVALFDDTGSVVERYEYDAYGKCTVFTDMADWDGSTPTTASKSALGNPYTFTGRRLDEITSNLVIMYYRARYYDPEVGRFMQTDPLGIDPANRKINSFRPQKQYTDGMNIHEYVKSNSIHLSDPYGLESNNKVCCKVKTTTDIIPAPGSWAPPHSTSSCSQYTIDNPKGMSPGAACRCYFKNRGGFKGSPYSGSKTTSHSVYDWNGGECCECKMYLETAGHTRIRVKCDKEEFIVHVYPDIVFAWDPSTIKVEKPEDDGYNGFYLLKIFSTISCKQAEYLKSLHGQPWYFSSIRFPFVPGDGNCAQFALALFNEMTNGCP